MIKFLILSAIILTNYSSIADDNVQITSSNLTFNKKELTATFEGNVKIFFEDQVVITEKLIVHYSNSKEKHEITKIIFPTKIKAIKAKKDVIVANSGEFDNLTKTLTLIGNVCAQKDDNVLVTRKMVYYAKLKSVE